MASRARQLKSAREADHLEPTDATDAASPGGWARVRAASLLLVLLTAVGATTALVIGAIALGAVTVLDRALG